MEFVKLKPINRICPCCGNGNYMRIISGKNVGKLNVKCINCNSYYNYDELLERDNSKPLNGADGRKIDDLISRAAAIEYLMTNMGWRDEDGYEVDDADEKRAVITHLVNGIPAVDAVPVVHAHGGTRFCEVEEMPELIVTTPRPEDVLPILPFSIGDYEVTVTIDTRAPGMKQARRILLGWTAKGPLRWRQVRKILRTYSRRRNA